MRWIGSFRGMGACSSHMVVHELDLITWWSMSLDSGSIALHAVISSSIYTINKQIGGVNN